MGTTFSHSSTNHLSVRRKRPLRKLERTMLQQIAAFGPNVEFTVLYDRFCAARLLTKGMKKADTPEKRLAWLDFHTSIAVLSTAIWQLGEYGYIYRTDRTNGRPGSTYSVSLKGTALL